MRKRRRPLKMVGGVFYQPLGTTGNPTTEDAQDNAGDSDEDEDEENRLRLIEVQQLTHPGNHLGKKFTDLRKQGTNDRSGRSSLKSSSFHKNLWNLSRTEQENQQRKDSGEDNEVTNLGDGEYTETILQGKNSHQLMRPQIACLIQVTVVTKTRTTRKAEKKACGLRT